MKVQTEECHKPRLLEITAILKSVTLTRLEARHHYGLHCFTVRFVELVAWFSVRAGKLDSSRASRCKNIPQTRANCGLWHAAFNNARLAAYFSSRRTRLVTLFFAGFKQPAFRLDYWNANTINTIAG
jgi:hypothetical protein